MARYYFEDTTRDGMGRVIQGATVTVYLAGTTTLATCYALSTGGAITGSTMVSDSAGVFGFWVDDGDYNWTGTFKIIVSKSNYQSRTKDNIVLYPSGAINSTGAIYAYVTTAQFDKTSDTVLANIPGLSATLTAGKTYWVHLSLFTSGYTNHKIAFSGGSTMTAMRIGDSSSTYLTALDVSSNINNGIHAWEGTVVVNVGGTFTVQFAQSTTNVTASSVLIGSSMLIKQVN